MPSEIDFTDSGTGPAILYVPGSFSSAAAWRAVQARLPGYRHAATSLCGYGGTAEARDPDRPGLAEQIDVVAACAARIGAPFRLVGHFFGSTVALCAAASGQVAPRAIVTFEANPVPILRGGPHDALVEEAFGTARAFAEAYEAGDPDAAGRIIDFWGGAGAFAAIPEAARAYCRATAGVNVLDWRSVEDWPVDREALARVQVPVLLVRGQHANPVMRATTEALAARIPGARTAVISCASHFPITTHPDAAATLIGDFLTAELHGS